MNGGIAQPPISVADERSADAEAGESGSPHGQDSAAGGREDSGLGVTAAAQAALWLPELAGAYAAREGAYDRIADHEAHWRSRWMPQAVPARGGMSVPGQFVFGVVLGVALFWLWVLIPTGQVIATGGRP